MIQDPEEDPPVPDEETALPEDLELDDDEEDEDDEEEDEAEGAEADGAAPVKVAKKDEDPDAELLYKDTKVPTQAQMMEAMHWAFDGKDIEEELLENFARHAVAVLNGNRVMNLTAILDPKEMAAKHYLDTWIVTQYLPLMGRHVVDMGTGAGFPGVPVAMTEPMARVSLVDSTKKRIDFLEKVVAELELKNARPVWSRCEDFLAKNPCDVVLVRGLSSVRENVRVLRKVRHSLKDLIMFKGPSWSREVRAGEREAERLGYSLNTVYEHELPGEMGQRAILVYRAPGGQGL